MPEPRRAPMAMCPHCNAPLISTMQFPGAEFYCLECGAHVGFLSPRPAEVMPELQARHDELRAEWDEHAEPFLRGHGGWFEWCEQCKPHAEPHCDHATEQEWAAHNEALAWLKERATAKTGGAL